MNDGITLIVVFEGDKRMAFDFNKQAVQPIGLFASCLARTVWLSRFAFKVKDYF